MCSIPHHITLKFINALGDGHTDMHAHADTYRHVKQQFQKSGTPGLKLFSYNQIIHNFRGCTAWGLCLGLGKGGWI